MKNLLATVLFATIGLYAEGQSPLKPFGEVSLDEMKIKSCPYDSTAQAVILFDYGSAVLDVSRGSSMKRHVRIKIFKKEAADEWAKELVLFDKTDQFFTKFKGSTYNLVDGKIVKTEISDDAVFKTKFDRYTSQVQFTLPQVNEGSIIEYTYTISSHELFGLPDWQFQYEIPVLWSEYNTHIPTYFSFRKDWSGFLRPTINESKHNGDIQRIVVTNAPAFKEEPYMSSKENYISRLSLHLEKLWAPGQMERSFIKQWGYVAALVYESDLWLQIKASFFLKKIAEEQTAGIDDPEKKVQALYDYVKKNVAWDETTDVYPDHQFKEVLEKKKGTSSEINGLLISLLMKLDIDANPVLLRTRERGFIKPFIPMASQFNDVICHIQIGEKTMLIDATNKGLPITALPERCLNGAGLVVRKETYDWVELKTIKSRQAINGDFNLQEDGSISGKITILRDGNYGNMMRQAYTKASEEDYIKNSVDASWEISKSSFENIDDSRNPVKETHELNVI
ncbi:MAG TPA: transglutaminase domain-containing protein, partial [Cyclobacteriaceae bacterium]|nr:transglutaminase domain-containing protein [Cyclobacteriaceae bacterium]